jgi:hypothetical protein
MNLRKILLVMCVLISGPVSAGLADGWIDDRGLPAEGTITAYAKFTVTLQLASGRNVQRHISNIRMLEIIDNEALAEAEKLRDKKKFKEALRKYKTAEYGAEKLWMKKLILVRAYQTMCDAAFIDKAVKEWMSMVEKSGRSDKVAALKMAPTKFGPKGSEKNNKAIKLLDRNVARLMPKKEKDKDYLTGMLTLMLKLQDVQGDTVGTAKTTQMIDQLEGKTDAVRPDDRRVPVAPPTGGARLLVLSHKLKAGQVDEVIAGAAGRIDDCEDEQLPATLLLLGKAQKMKYEQTGLKDRALLAKAGLNLMLIFAEFPSSSEAPEALYLAAKVNEQLGDKTAAAKALRELVTNYGNGGGNEWVKKATADLAAMNQLK